MNEMPWKKIAQATIGFATVTTWVCWGAVRQERERRFEDNRFRWTDRNRWE